MTHYTYIYSSPRLFLFLFLFLFHSHPHARRLVDSNSATACCTAQYTSTNPPIHHSASQSANQSTNQFTLNYPTNFPLVQRYLRLLSFPFISFPFKVTRLISSALSTTSLKTTRAHLGFASQGRSRASSMILAENF